MVISAAGKRARARERRDGCAEVGAWVTVLSGVPGESLFRW